MGLLHFIGAEEHETKYYPPFNGKPFRVVSEWWVHQWVGKLYKHYSMLRVTPNPTYDILVELIDMKPKERELAVNLYILKFAEL
jgi:hypothetical protein